MRLGGECRNLHSNQLEIFPAKLIPIEEPNESEIGLRRLDPIYWIIPSPSCRVVAVDGDWNPVLAFGDDFQKWDDRIKALPCLRRIICSPNRCQDEHREQLITQQMETVMPIPI